MPSFFFGLCAGTCRRAQKICAYGKAPNKLCYRCFQLERAELCRVCNKSALCAYSNGRCKTCAVRQRQRRDCAQCGREETVAEKYRERWRCVWCIAHQRLLHAGYVNPCVSATAAEVRALSRKQQTAPLRILCLIEVWVIPLTDECAG